MNSHSTSFHHSIAIETNLGYIEVIALIDGSMNSHERVSFRCFVFDMDGTLVQTNQLIFDSFNHVAQKFTGKIYSPEEIVALFGPPEEEVIRTLVGVEHMPEAMEEYLRFYRSEHRARAKLHSGMDDILRLLKKNGKLLALFTGKGRATTSITLQECGIEDLFDLVVTGDDVQNHKPSSEGLRRIMHHFSLAPHEVLMVGDAPADVQAAHEAGVNIAAVLWDSYAKETMLTLQTDYTFHDTNEFREWLQQYGM